VQTLHRLNCSVSDCKYLSQLHLKPKIHANIGKLFPVSQKLMWSQLNG
jgi:hypothetical protein